MRGYALQEVVGVTQQGETQERPGPALSIKGMSQ